MGLTEMICILLCFLFSFKVSSLLNSPLTLLPEICLATISYFTTPCLKASKGSPLLSMAAFQTSGGLSSRSLLQLCGVLSFWKSPPICLISGSRLSCLLCLTYRAFSLTTCLESDDASQPSTQMLPLSWSLLQLLWRKGASSSPNMDGTKKNPNDNPCSVFQFLLLIYFFFVHIFSVTFHSSQILV